MTDVECQARRVHVANVLLAGPPLPNFSPRKKVKEKKGTHEIEKSKDM